MAYGTYARGQGAPAGTTPCAAILGEDRLGMERTTSEAHVRYGAGHASDEAGHAAASLTAATTGLSHSTGRHHLANARSGGGGGLSW